MAVKVEPFQTMANHSWAKTETSVLLFVGITSVAVAVPLIIAVATGHVSPYIPYISETAANFPEAGIFNFFLSIACIVWIYIVFVRYLVVEEKTRKLEKSLYGTFNLMGLVFGAIATAMLILVAAYPTTSIGQVHNTAAVNGCMCIVLYMLCQTWISSKLSEPVAKLRMCLLVLSGLDVVFATVYAILGSLYWEANHWVGKKTPEDRGFLFYAMSAGGEWIFAVLFLSFVATFYTEFKKYTFHFHVESKAQDTLQQPIYAIHA